MWKAFWVCWVWKREEEKKEREKKKGRTQSECGIVPLANAARSQQRGHSHQLAQEGNAAGGTALSVTLRAQDNPLPLFIRG